MADDLKMVNYLESGYRSEVERQKMIANNLANMFSPDYRRYEVEFEDILQKAIDQKKKAGVRDLSVEILQPKDQPINAYGNDVAMDMEISDMVKNSLKHRAFMLMLKKKYQQFESAMNVR